MFPQPNDIFENSSKKGINPTMSGNMFCFFHFVSTNYHFLSTNDQDPDLVQTNADK